MEESKMIATPSRTKEILTQFDLRAKKGLGQNFLVDPMLVKRCAQEAQCKGAVIEIGPGLGALTEALALTARHVTCYEVDPDMVKVLHSTLASYDNVEIVLQDFLHADIDAKIKELYRTYGKVSVCANLPYYITTPIIMSLLESKLPIERLVVMVQKEVAERMIAKPGTKMYGALSVAVQYYTDPYIVMDVPPKAFLPAPEVTSAVICCPLRSEPPVKVHSEAYFFRAVKAGFAQRRKTFSNTMKTTGLSKEQIEAILDKVNIDGSRRGETFTLDEFALIGNAWYELDQETK